MSVVSKIRWIRTLRTPSSERLLGSIEGRDAVAVDLHFLQDGAVTGTVTVLDGCGIGDKDLAALLAQIDDDFLPGVDLDEGGVTFTVVFARAVESFESAREA